MSYFEDAKALVGHSKETFKRITEIYNQSLKEKEIKSTLLIEIKNLMENLRSALDYTAHGVFDRYGSSSKGDPKIYFPYASISVSMNDFRNQNRIEYCIPGIKKDRPDIVTKIESYQHFSDKNNKWLPLFMDLNNENKHQKLTPQNRKEYKELKITSGGASISMGQGASISIGTGASIRIGNTLIPGSQTISTENPPITLGGGKTEIITWVSFNFSTNDEPVLPLLQQALTGVEKIVNEMSTI